MDFFGLIAINDWLLLFGLIITPLYFYTTWHFDYWTKQGVPGPKPLPFYLNFKNIAAEGLKWDTRMVNEYGKTVGAFEGRMPYLITTDDDIMREVFTKQFHNFAERRNLSFPEESGLNDALMTLTEDTGWKRVRDLMSPTFSSGKLKKLTKSMNECSLAFVKMQKEKAGQIINLKESFGDVTMRLIASVAFGVDISCDETFEEFRSMGKRVLDNQSGFAMFLQVCNFIAPTPTQWITKALKIDIYDLGPIQYFGKIVDHVMETRTKGDKPLDFIQLMANAHNDDEAGMEKKNGMTKREVLANGTTFFMAGFDTIATGMSVLFYQFALNPEAQERAYKEVAEIMKKKNGIDYDDLHELKYLDWCLHEALRMIPPALKLERKTKNDVTIKGIRIEKDMLVSVPVLQLHYDKERWENPDVFRPERFSDEEKKDRSPYSWMPFGYGPRNCIGMRLAIVEIKVVAAHMLYNYKVEPCSETQIPYEFTKFGKVGEGMEVKLTARS